MKLGITSLLNILKSIMLLNLVNEKLKLVIIILIISCYNLSNKFSGNCNGKLLLETGTRDELSITLYLQSEINFCSVRMPVNARCYILTSLPPEPSSILYYLELN